MSEAWRKRLSRYGPWVIAAVAITAILVQYPPSRIAAEMARGDLLATVPYATLLIFSGIFGLGASDWWVINGSLADEGRPVSYLHVVRARCGMSLLGLLGYGAGVGGMGVWIARATGIGASLAAGVALYLMATDLVAVSAVAGAAYWIGKPDVSVSLGVVAPSIAGVLVALMIISPTYGIVPDDRLPRMFRPWRRIAVRRALPAVALRTLNICWVTTMVWLGANAFGMPVPFVAMATYFPIVLVVGSMPVNVGGFGAVQGAWLMLAPWADSPEQVIAFSVLWQLVVAVAICMRGLPFVRAVTRQVAAGAS